MTPSDEKLRGRGWIDDARTRKVMDAIDAAAGKARFVGGCVRDALLGRAVGDIDIATVFPPEEAVKKLEAAGIKVVPTGIEHGTVTAVVDGKPFEVTTLRKDVETDGRHATVAYTDDWAADAARRDFTMNALYADPDGRLYDPVGGGIVDARAGRVRFIGDAETRIREDYLRILRFFRFHAHFGQGEPDETGLKACAALAEGLDRLSAERVQKEILRLVAADDPLPSLRAMAAAGILARVLPEASQFERFQRLVTVEVEQLFTCDPVLRLGALVDGDEAALRAMAARLRLSNNDRDRIIRMHTDETKIVSYLSIREVRRALYRLGVRLFRDRVMLGWAADRKDSNAVQWRALLAVADSWQRPTFPLTGEDVMKAGVPRGPEVGRVLAEVEDWWVESDFIDDPFSLAERLKAVVQATVY